MLYALMEGATGEGVSWKSPSFIFTYLMHAQICHAFLTFWRRNYFFLILAHPVYKMWIIQAPRKLALWNKLHFEEKKTESVEHV